MNSKFIRLHILPGENPRLEDRAVYEQTFALWERVWAQTFSELEGKGEVHSDDFTRQHEVLSLLDDRQCIALVCHRFVDISNPAIRQDSYFRAWPADAIQALGAEGSRVAIGSQITLHPDFRKSQAGGSLKNLITFLSLRRLRETTVDAISGTMRADKGMHRLFYDCGAYPLKQNILFHNVPVDLVAFFPRKRPLFIPAENQTLVEQLWQGRADGLDSPSGGRGSSSQRLGVKKTG